MTTFTNVFGNNTVPPSEYRYASYTLTVNESLVWPENYSGTTGLLSASIIDLSASGAGLQLTLPPANEVSTGRDILLRNIGGNSIEILLNGGSSLVTLATGESKYVYITNNSTAAGSWQAFTFGTGTSSADASLLAGAGLQASAGKIRIASAYKSMNTTYAMITSDRGKLLDAVTGSFTVNVLQASVAGDGFVLYIRNSSAGSITLDGFGTELIDGSLTKTVFPDESLALLCNGSAWKSVGYGRDATFVFSEIVVDAALPSTVLSSADVAGRMIRVSGVATGNITVTLPAIDNIYFVNTESGLGAFSATFTTGAGSTVVLGADQKTALYSDGININTAITTSLVSVLALADGSAAAPSINFALDTDTGLFRVGDGSVGISANGTLVAFSDATGLNANRVTTANAQITGGAITGITDLAVADGGTGASTAANARTNLGLGSAALLNSPIPIANGGTAATTAADARTNLGLGTIAVVNSPVPIANGGTAATTAAGARTSLDAQQTLISGTNIKTLNTVSLLGAGDITITAGASGGGTNRVFYENDITVTDNYTITTNKNAISAGPITINSGITVTVPVGSTWVVA